MQELEAENWRGQEEEEEVEEEEEEEGGGGGVEEEIFISWSLAEVSGSSHVASLCSPENLNKHMQYSSGKKQFLPAYIYTVSITVIGKCLGLFL
jgi:hypothetical protein